jgi:zinc protease
MNARRLLRASLLAGVACFACAEKLPAPGAAAPHAALAAPSASATAAPPFAPPPGDPLRSVPPQTVTEEVAPSETPQVLELTNGLRIALLERHGFPLVSVRLSIAFSASDLQGDLRATLARAAFLTPAGAEASSVECASTGCAVAMSGASDELADMIAREASLARSEPPLAEEQRLYAIAAERYPEHSGSLWFNAFHAERVALLGDSHPYTAFAATPKPIGLDELRRWRGGAFVPSASTLVVVGDATLAQVRGEATRRFGSWTGRASTRDATTPPPLPDARVFMTQNAYNPDEFASVVARGPTWGDPDVAPLLVATKLAESAMPSPSPCRDDVALAGDAVAVGPFAFFPVGSKVSMGGVFPRGKGLEVIKVVLRQIRASRGGDATDAALDHAKARALSTWRSAVATRGAAAAWLQVALDAGAPDTFSDFPARIAAVSAADVRRVTGRYLAEDSLRLVLIGKKQDFERLPDLGLGDQPRFVDDRGAFPWGRTTAPKKPQGRAEPPSPP